MENNKAIAGFEKCFDCGKPLRDGIGRFRKIKGAFCIECYKDKTRSNADSEAGKKSRNFSFAHRNSSNDVSDFRN